MREQGLPPPPRIPLLESLRGAIDDASLSRALSSVAAQTFDRFLSLIVKAVPKVQTFQLTINPTSCAANTTTAQVFSCPGLTTRDIVCVNKPTNTAGLVIGNAFVSSDDNITIVFGNLTGSPIDPGSEVYLIVATRI